MPWDKLLSIEKMHIHAQSRKHKTFICMTFLQRRANVGPTLYKCYTNVLCLLAAHLITTIYNNSSHALG